MGVDARAAWWRAVLRYRRGHHLAEADLVARIRSVHPDICVSETMAELPAELERTFVRLWTHCDDYGRCVHNPRLIKAALYPLHDCVTATQIESELMDLEERGLIASYEVDGITYLYVRSWSEYQHPQRRSKSRCPVPPDASEQSDEGSANAPRGFAEDDASSPPDWARGEGVGEGEEDGDVVEGLPPVTEGRFGVGSPQGQVSLINHYSDEWHANHAGMPPATVWCDRLRAQLADHAHVPYADMELIVGWMGKDGKDPKHLPLVVSDFYKDKQAGVV
jgi:hypothetical protein